MKRQAQFLNAGEARSEFLTFTNAIMSEDGWMHVAPLGDFEGIARVPDGKGGIKKFKAIQRIDKDAIAAMLNDQQANRRGVSKYLEAPPLYVGHPDAEPRLYPDHEPKGVFANFKESTGGMFGEPILTAAGSMIVESKKYPGISARFDTEFIGEENGVQVFRPTRFVSAGLVLNPNLPTFLNENMKKTEAEILNDAAGAAAMSASSSAMNASLAAKSAADNPAIHAAAFKANASAADAHHAAAESAGARGDSAAASMHGSLEAMHKDKAAEHLSDCYKAGGRPEFTNDTEKTLKAEFDNGDFPGHPFHGNQYADGASGRSATNRASSAAHNASVKAMNSGDKKDHAAAAVAHKQAAAEANKAGNKTLTLYHDSMANMHSDMAKGRAGVTNENETETETDMDTKKIIPLLIKHGATITNEAEESVIITALDQLGVRAAGAGELQTKLAKAETDFTNERQARINGELGHALGSGRITAAQRPDWERRLKADFTNELAALDKLTPVVKTGSVIKRTDGGAEIVNEKQRTEFLNEVIDDLAKEHSMDRRKDYNRLFKLAQQKRPDLFQAMKRSPLKKG